MAPAIFLFFLGLKNCKRLFRSRVLMDNRMDCFHHVYRVATLEDVAAHVDAGCARLDRVVGHLQGVLLWEFLAAGDHDGDRAAVHDFLEVLDVVGLDDVGAELRGHAAGEAHVAGVPDHVLADGGDRDDGDAVALRLVDVLGEPQDGVAFEL